MKYILKFPTIDRQLRLILLLPTLAFIVWLVWAVGKSGENGYFYEKIESLGGLESNSSVIQTEEKKMRMSAIRKLWGSVDDASFIDYIRKQNSHFDEIKLLELKESDVKLGDVKLTLQNVDIEFVGKYENFETAFPGFGRRTVSLFPRKVVNKVNRGICRPQAIGQLPVCGLRKKPMIRTNDFRPIRKLPILIFLCIAGAVLPSFFYGALLANPFAHPKKILG